MHRPHTAPIRPIGAGRRALAGLLGGMYLALALGTAMHVGEHDPSGLEWLPSEFHHHVFSLEETSSPGRTVPGDLCVACQMSRLALRLDSDLPEIPQVAPVRSGVLPEIPLAPGLRERFPRTSRGPPAA